MSDNVEFTPEARWKLLREEGRKVLVDLSSNGLIDDKPAWLDEERFSRAKKAVEEFYIGVVYSSFTGLLLILQLPDGLEPLLSTGNSKDVPSLYKRYLSTILHVNSWYEDDIFNPETKGYKSIRQVRSMHRRVQQLMNEKHQVKGTRGEEHSWMTQYDVALTQWAFIGLAMLFPHKTAMVAAKPEDLELINYYWRVLGHLMGMRDDMNLCQFDKYEDIREFDRLIFENEYLAKFREHSCETGLEMSKAICLALNYFTPLVTFNSLAHWWKDCVSFNGYKLEPLSIKDRAIVMWTELSFKRLLKNRGFLRFSNRLHKRRFEQRLKKRDAVFDKLKDQYSNCPHLTFYSDRIDYFNKPGATETTKTTGVRDGRDQDSTNDNNNNSHDTSTPLSKPVGTQAPIATNTFKGCPMGYDTILPAFQSQENGVNLTQAC